MIERSACPCLRESLMQYCGAAPVAKFVPYSESLLSRCGSDSHRYCELYLSMAHPEAPPAGADAISTPEWLNYTANHLWLDVTEDGVCHAGIDAFLSRTLGKVDRIGYVWTKGLHRPTAVLTVDGCDLQIVFPNEMMLVNCNLYLRADPSRLTTEPYAGGWLFEGEPLPETARNLVAGPQAREWIEREERRMSEFVHQQTVPRADGGRWRHVRKGRGASPGPRPPAGPYSTSFSRLSRAKRDEVVRIPGYLVFTAGVLAALGAGWIAFPHAIYTTRPQPVDFSHKVHADKAGLKCEDCHAFRDDGTYAGIPALDQCAGCHARAHGRYGRGEELHRSLRHAEPRARMGLLRAATRERLLSPRGAREAGAAQVRAVPRPTGFHQQPPPLPAGTASAATRAISGATAPRASPA